MTPSTIVTADLESRLLTLATRLDDYRKRYETLHDSRAVFTCAYVQITRILAAGLRESNFHDPLWVVSLAQSFAGKYTEALDAADQNLKVAPAWQKVFDTFKSGRTSILEDLVFGMTAHIVHDLPTALLDVGLADPNGLSHISDFHRVNDVLGSNVQVIEDAVLNRYGPFLKFIDSLDKGYDQILSNYGFRLSRGLAWYNAARMLEPTTRVSIEASITRSVVILVDNVKNPPWLSVRIVLRGVRYLVSILRVWPSPEK